MPKVVNLIEQTGQNVRLSPGSSNGGFGSIATNDEEVSAEMTAYLYSLGHCKSVLLLAIRATKRLQSVFRLQAGS